jgi:hypothetical protein
MTGTLPLKTDGTFRFIGQIHHTTPRTNVPDIREKKAHFFTDFLRHIHRVFPLQYPG